MPANKIRLVFLDRPDSNTCEASFLLKECSELAGKGEIPPTLYITHVNQRSIALGYYGDIDEEINVEACKELNVAITRRNTGAGHIYADNATILVGMALDNENYMRLANGNVDTYARLMGEFAARVARRLGVKEAEYFHLGDVRVGGRKMMGMGYSENPEKTGHVIAFFINFWTPDPAPQLKVLKVPPEKFLDKGVKDLSEYVASIEKDTTDKSKVNLEALVDAALACAREVFLGYEIEKGELTQKEEEVRKRHYETYASEEWNYLRSSKRRFGNIPEGYGYGRSKFKARKLITSDVLINRDNIIEDLMIGGDMWTVPDDAGDLIERALKGVNAADKELVNKKIEEVYSAPGVQFVAISLDELKKPILESIDKALAQKK